MRRVVWAIALVVAAGQAGAEVTAEMRLGINFPGNDIGSFFVGDNDPQTCQAACDVNEDCEAWTFVKPGIQGPEAVCWLKNAVAAPEVTECCISAAVDGQGASTAGGFYARPKIGATDVDFCLYAGTECGQKAADLFCRSWGYKEADTWETAASESTYTMLSQMICENNGCIALRNVTCVPK